jgi:hypothetical protein
MRPRQNAIVFFIVAPFTGVENRSWCWTTKPSFAIIYKWYKPFKENISLYIETCTVGVLDTGHIRSIGFTQQLKKT